MEIWYELISIALRDLIIKLIIKLTQRSAITMLAFFFSSSKLGSHTNEAPANRNWQQVFCNSLVGTVLAILYYSTLNTFDPYPFLSTPYLSTFFLGGFLSFYSCTTGIYSINSMYHKPMQIIITNQADTWASEIGIMSSSSPRLITEPWRIVPKGTNGGVTLLGLSASFFGGFFIGITFWFSSCVTLQQVQDNYGNDSDVKLDFDGLIESQTSQYWLIALATFCGLLGSVIDSLLGATLQFSGVSENHKGVIFEDPNKSQKMKRISGRFILSNNDVNWISTLITCFVGGCISVWLFC